MKTQNVLSILIVLFFSSFSVNAQKAQKIKEDAVPAVVKAAFAKMHPGTKAKWEKEDGNYEAGFDDKTGEGSVTFTPSGNWLEKESEINTSELPAGARAYVAKNYNKVKTKEASRIIDPKGVVTYEAELGDRDVIFDSSGKFVKEVLKNKEDKEDGKGKD